MSGDAEWWVLRVIDPGAVLTPMMVADLECVGGELCEPVERCESQDQAIESAIRGHQRTGKVHKVVLSVGV